MDCWRHACRPFPCGAAARHRECQVESQGSRAEQAAGDGHCWWVHFHARLFKCRRLHHGTRVPPADHGIRGFPLGCPLCLQTAPRSQSMLPTWAWRRCCREPFSMQTSGTRRVGCSVGLTACCSALQGQRRHLGLASGALPGESWHRWRCATCSCLMPSWPRFSWTAHTRPTRTWPPATSRQAGGTVPQPSVWELPLLSCLPYWAILRWRCSLVRAAYSAALLAGAGRRVQCTPAAH